MVMIKQKCDFCKKPATYDTKTVLGPWAYVCDEHFEKYSVKTEGLYKKVEPPEQELIRTCIICRNKKPLSDFYVYTDAAGVERYRRECKVCNLITKKRMAMKKK